MDYYSTEIEHKQALIIQKLEEALDEQSVHNLKEDRRYIIELANVISRNKEHGLSKADLKKVNEQLIKLI